MNNKLVRSQEKVPDGSKTADTTKIKTAKKESNKRIIKREGLDPANIIR